MITIGGQSGGGGTVDPQARTDAAKAMAKDFEQVVIAGNMPVSPTVIPAQIDTVLVNPGDSAVALFDNGTVYYRTVDGVAKVETARRLEASAAANSIEALVIAGDMPAVNTIPAGVDSLLVNAGDQVIGLYDNGTVYYKTPDGATNQETARKDASTDSASAGLYDMVQTDVPANVYPESPNIAVLEAAIAAINTATPDTVVPPDKVRFTTPLGDQKYYATVIVGGNIKLIPLCCSDTIYPVGTVLPDDNLAQFAPDTRVGIRQTDQSVNWTAVGLDGAYRFIANDGGTQPATAPPANTAPVFDSTAILVATEDTAYSYSITVSDADGDALTITAPTLPAWLTFTDNTDGTATLTGTPATADIGNDPVVLRASDGTVTTDQSFTIVVEAVGLSVTGSVDATDPLSLEITMNEATKGTPPYTAYSITLDFLHAGQNSRQEIISGSDLTAAPASSGGLTVTGTLGSIAIDSAANDLYGDIDITLSVTDSTPQTTTVKL